MTSSIHSTPSTLLIHLAQRIQEYQNEIKNWYSAHTQKITLPFYSSVDLRDASFKIAPVDNNLYPAGFNRICHQDLRMASQILKKQINLLSTQTGKPIGNRVLILPESHTQNLHYIDNLYCLNELIQNAGYQTLLGWYGSEKSIVLNSTSGKKLNAYRVRVEENFLKAGSFTPDWILLNNDFSGNYPKLLDEIIQPIFPSHTLGWHSRRKSTHFQFYNQLAQEFADLIQIDPWIIQINTEKVDSVDFNEGIGLDRVQDAVDRMLIKTRDIYKSHSIQREPFVFIKNNAGTYGMGIMVVRSSNELKVMNRRTKNKMSVGKNRQAINSVIIQEGIPTTTLVDQLPAEPVIYLLGEYLMGGILRANLEKGEEENLNSQGMIFKKLCMSDLYSSDRVEPVLELVYGSIAQISALATGLELEQRKEYQNANE